MLAGSDTDPDGIKVVAALSGSAEIADKARSGCAARGTETGVIQVEEGKIAAARVDRSRIIIHGKCVAAGISAGHRLLDSLARRRAGEREGIGRASGRGRIGNCEAGCTHRGSEHDGKAGGTDKGGGKHLTTELHRGSRNKLGTADPNRYRGSRHCRSYMPLRDLQSR